MGKGGVAGMLFHIGESEEDPFKEMLWELRLNNQSQTCKGLKKELSRRRKQGTGRSGLTLKHSDWSCGQAMAAIVKSQILFKQFGQKKAHNFLIYFWGKE